MPQPRFSTQQQEKSYKRRLRVLRMMFGETQAEFAKRLGIPFKRWNEYEGQGYPMPRQTAWLIGKKVAPNITDWIWFGHEVGPSEDFLMQAKKMDKLL